MDIGNIESQNVNDTMEVIYDSGELAAAVTSVAISGLNGDVDQEYQLIVRTIGGFDGTSYYWIRPNNDSTSSHYGYQQLYGGNTTAGASRSTADSGLCFTVTTALNDVGIAVLSLVAKSGYLRTAIAKWASPIVTTTVGYVQLWGEVWNDTSNNITSLVVVSDQTNGLGIGTRIILLRKVTATTATTRTGVLNVKGTAKYAWQEIYATTLASAATSVDITGLTGNTDVLYRLRVRQVGGAANTYPYYRFNGDGAGNNGIQSLTGFSTTVEAYRVVGSGGISTAMGDGNYTTTTAGNQAENETIIYAKSGYVRVAILIGTTDISTTTVTRVGISGISWNNTSSELTSLHLDANETDGWGIGTYISLERLNL